MIFSIETVSKFFFSKSKKMKDSLNNLAKSNYTGKNFAINVYFIISNEKQDIFRKNFASVSLPVIDYFYSILVLMRLI